MSVRFQITIDARDSVRLADFWANALGYIPEPPPGGFATWNDYWRNVGVPEEELVDGTDCIVDPTGAGPRIWFHVVPEPKTCKNRLHFDLRVSGGRSFPIEVRRERVEAEAARLVGIGATRLEALHEEGVDHYGVAMMDPEGNEFDIN
jgi:glyoxalase superfamily protein